MKHLIVRIGLVALVSAGTGAFADVDDCDDYLMRHYRQDLKPLSVSFIRISSGIVPSHSVSVRVKNVGQVAIGDDASARLIRVNLGGGLIMNGSYLGKIQPGATRWISLGRTKTASFTHCGSRTIQIDTTRTAGQWGCNCFANDTASVMTYNSANRRLCVIPVIGG